MHPGKPRSQSGKAGQAQLENGSYQFEVLQPACRQFAGQQVVHLQAPGGDAAYAEARVQYAWTACEPMR